MHIIRRFLATLPLAAGALGCADVSVTAPIPGPNATVYVLQSAGGGALPALVQRIVESETGTQMEVYVLSDTLQLDGHGRYDQRGRIEVRAGEAAVNRMRWVDHGTYAVVGGRAHFESDYLENVAFDGAVSGGSVLLIQDLAGEGSAVDYVFRPAR